MIFYLIINVAEDTKYGNFLEEVYRPFLRTFGNLEKSFTVTIGGITLLL